MKDKKSKKKERTKKRESMKPMLKEEDVPKNPDPHIDQDFPGYPHAPSEYKLINPQTKTEKKVAKLGVKDGEKMDKTEKRANKDKQESNGSANAFGGTESVSDDENVY